MRRLGKVNKLKLLEFFNRLDFFSDFSVEQRDLLFDAVDGFFHCKEGRYVHKQGDLDSNFYLLLSGHLEVSKGESDTKVGDIRAGEFFGEGSFIEIRAKSTTARATKDSILLCISRQGLNKMPSTIRELFKDAIIEGMAKRIVYLTEMLQQPR